MYSFRICDFTTGQLLTSGTVFNARSIYNILAKYQKVNHTMLLCVYIRYEEN